MGLSEKEARNVSEERLVAYGASARQRLARITDWESLARRANYRSSDLAVACGVCLRQMERFFRQHLGKNPRRWLRELQCQKARQLIENGYSTKAAALELHFSSEAEFCHAFKRIFGETPQSFAPTPARETLR
jgi:AraC-like DNA-binding protein